MLAALSVVAPARAAEPTPSGPLPNLSVELHSHLFMKPGLGWLYNGSFDEKARATHWRDRLSSKATADTLQASGVGIVVVALFAHPLYTGDLRDSIRSQIAAARKFCSSHDDWALARTPTQARLLLANGKRVMVLSLEGSAGVIEAEDDMVEFIDHAGIAIVTPLHLVDDRYGGVATMNGYQRVANPLGLVDSLLDPYAAGAVATNPRGLTPLGLRLVAELAARGVWVDLTHASDRAIDEMRPLLTQAKQPLLFTHTSPRRYRPAERSISGVQLAAVAKSGGIIGLLPSEDGFSNITVARRYCPTGCNLRDCQGSVHALAQIYTEISAIVGSDAIVFGSDYNGGMRHLAGGCRSGTRLDDPRGLWHMGLHNDVWQALVHLGAPVPPLRRTLQNFLRSWAQVKPAPLTSLLAKARVRGDHGDEESLRAAPWPATRADGPGIELSVSLGGSLLPGDDALSAGVELRILKDMAEVPHGEPAFYYLHLAASGWLVPPDELSLFHGYFAPVGARAQWYDNRLWGDLFSVRLGRNLALDQPLAAQWLAIRGGVRTMPGVLKAPGQHNFFLGLEAGALGYKYVKRRIAADEMHAFVPVEGMAEAGVSLWPSPRLRLTLYGEIRADVALVRFAPLYHQTDVSVSGGARLGLPEGVVEPYVYYRWRGARRQGEEWRGVGRVDVGARFPF